MPVQVSAEGEAVALLENIAAGSNLSDLAMLAVDETGKPAEAGTAGKMQLSWTRGAKRMKLADEATPLPNLEVCLRRKVLNDDLSLTLLPVDPGHLYEIVLKPLNYHRFTEMLPVLLVLAFQKFCEDSAQLPMRWTSLGSEGALGVSGQANYTDRV